MPIKGLNDLADFSAEKIRGLIILTRRLDEKPEPRALAGKVMALLFLSPSLKNLSSFESALTRLGCGRPTMRWIEYVSIP
jgi:ornithine carbamoyltransferase